MDEPECTGAEVRRGLVVSYPTPFCLFVLRQGLSLSLDLGWQTASPSTAPVAYLRDLRLQAGTASSGSFIWVLGFKLVTSCYSAITVSHEQ